MLLSASFGLLLNDPTTFIGIGKDIKDNNVRSFSAAKLFTPTDIDKPLGAGNDLTIVIVDAGCIETFPSGLHMFTQFTT